MSREEVKATGWEGTGIDQVGLRTLWRVGVSQGGQELESDERDVQPEPGRE